MGKRVHQGKKELERFKRNTGKVQDDFFIRGSEKMRVQKARKTGSEDNQK